LCYAAAVAEANLWSTQHKTDRLLASATHRRSNTLTSLRVISRGEPPARPIEHVHVNRCPADVLVFSVMSSEVETSLIISRLVLVQRVLHPQPRTIQHVRINRGCAHVLVTNELLHSSDIISIRQQLHAE